MFFNDIFDWLLKVLKEWGYVGAFIVSILGNIIPFMPVPYLAAVFYLVTVVKLDALTLGFASGLGAAIGKLSSYFIGRGGRRLLREERRRELEVFRSLIGRYGALAIIIISSTPLPDDLVLIPMGLINYSIWKYLISCAIGKIILASLVAYSSLAFSEFLRFLLGGDVYTLPISLAVLLAFIYVILKLNWIRISEVFYKEGFAGVRKLIHKEGLRALIKAGRRAT